MRIVCVKNELKLFVYCYALGPWAFENPIERDIFQILQERRNSSNQRHGRFELGMDESCKRLRGEGSV